MRLSVFSLSIGSRQDLAIVEMGQCHKVIEGVNCPVLQLHIFLLDLDAGLFPDCGTRSIIAPNPVNPPINKPVKRPIESRILF